MKFDAELSPFASWILPNNGSAPYCIDFSEFFFGRQTAKSRPALKSEIVGIPNLAHDFRSVILAERPAENVYPTYASAWRTLHQFIQDQPDLPLAISLSDFGEVHGLKLKQWLLAQGKSAHSYKAIKWVIDSFARLQLHRMSAMPPRDALPEPDPTEPDFVALQRLSLVLRKHARAIFAMWKDGAALAKTGNDPRLGIGSPNGGWIRPENHAHLIYRLTETSVPSREEIIGQGLTPLTVTSGSKPRYNVKGPQCPIPGLKKNTRGYAAKLRWRFPTEADMAIFVWIVLICTGFNLAALLAIDITNPSTWYANSFQDPDHVLLFADKNKVGKKVYSPSKVKAEFHAYNIIKRLVEVTEPLRESLRQQLAPLIVINALNYSHQTQREIQKLEESIRSPWLFITLKSEIGKPPVKSLILSDGQQLNSIIRLVAKEANLLKEHPYLASLSTSQARDSMINFTFRHSRRISVARLAAQHSNYRSLKYYLARQKIKRANFRTVNEMLTHTFREIRQYEIFDEARIKIALKRGEITLEQERRLRDVRLRSSGGLACKNPTMPPPEIDPYHRSGELCRIQRCTGCINGIVFPESVRPLAYALADLRYLKGKTPLAAWKGSSFEEEEISIVQTLKLFDAQLVKQHFQERTNDLKNGRAVYFDVYPQY